VQNNTSKSGSDRLCLPPCLPEGNLGLDCPAEKMAMVQKTLIQVRGKVGLWGSQQRG